MLHHDYSLPTSYIELVKPLRGSRERKKSVVSSALSPNLTFSAKLVNFFLYVTLNKIR